MRWLKTLFVFALLLCAATSLMAITADPEARVELRQPDGTTITVRPVGDERSGRLVTLDGYTVIKDVDGWYRYAVKDASGRLVPSDKKVLELNAEMPGGAIDIPVVEKMLARSDDRLAPSVDVFNEDPVYTKSTQSDPVNNTLLMILIKFPDEAITYQPPAFEELMNQPNYFGIGSINDYYNEISYGQLSVNGTAVGWYTAAQPRAYYAYDDGNNWEAAAELAREAVLAADAAGLDFSLYDNDSDGNVDGIFIVHGGPGAENGYNGYPWSHAWSLTGAGLSAVHTDGVTINGYSMEPEKHGLSSMVRIGVFCHEYGHVIGLPDLYDTDYSSDGVGDWCLMSGGSWNGPPGYSGVQPAQMSAWCKVELGWVTPVNVTNDLTQIWIPEVELDPVVYRLWNQGSLGQQYFLIEYRRQIDFDQYLPGCGLAIWHVDETVSGNWNDNHRLVDLEERDGSETNAQSGDLFVIDLFAENTSPNSRDYNNIPTNVSVEVLSNQCTGGGLLVNLSTGLGACGAGIDSDGDGFNDCDDNCQYTYNPDQTDNNTNGVGDACEDWDADGIANADDNCLNTPNVDQADWDNDGIGDICDDSDEDGIVDADDNCVSTYNPDQSDWNSNGIGDLCDACCGRYTAGLSGNVDCSAEGGRNLADITRLIDRVYISHTELCCEENGNIDGDGGGAINLADITRLIDFVYISKQETAPCN